MLHLQSNTTTNDNNPSPIPLMSINIPQMEHSTRTISTSPGTSMSEPTCLSPTPPISILDDNLSTTSTLIDRIDSSKFHFAHVIKLPHGTNLLASDNQSTTICVNSIGNIIHLVTPTGYHIRSSRWPETEGNIIDLFWCEVLQVYLAVTFKHLYTLKYDLDQSLQIEKSLEFPTNDLSSKIFISCNTYRLYVYNSSKKSIDIYTLQFAHLRTKQLPDTMMKNEIEDFSCSDSFLVFNCKQLINKIIVLDPTTMTIEYEFDFSYRNISSMRCFDNENTIVFIGMRQDEENRLVFLSFGNENEITNISPIIVEKTIEHDQQSIHLLPNCRDLMILNINTARVQYLKYRS